MFFKLTSAALALYVSGLGLAQADGVIEYQPKVDVSYEFLETFQGDEVFETKKWIQSGVDKYSGQEWVQTIEYNERKPGIPGDKSLVVGQAHKHYGVVNHLETPVDNKGKDLVVQYEVRLHKGIGCSGAYLKLLTANDSFKPSDLNDSTPYTIMFGPDKCGSNNKVHVIFRVENPKTGEWEEKHMKAQVPMPIDTLSHLYTLAVKDNDDFTLYIDGEEKASGNLLAESDFEPPFQPPKEIDDPNDKKPEDWVDSAKIADPEATKPDDWDEDAPKKIEDMSVEKPSGWEDDEPLQIPDPAAEEPADWDEEDDGVWAAPLVENPKCAVGCGEWKRPMIDNPEYKGKWSAPMIDNPEYKGEWAPKRIENPGYYKVEKASDLSAIGAVAIEILANEDGIAFDNIFIGHDIAAAQKFAKETHAIKQPQEQSLEHEQKREADKKRREKALEDGGFMGKIEYAIGEAQDIYLQNPLPFVGGMVAVLLFMLYFCFGVGANKAPKGEYETYKKTDGDENEEDNRVEEVEDDEPVEDNEEDEEAEEEEEEEDEEPVRRRSGRTPRA